MKILAPISSPDEVEMLVASGADELYCGVVPPEWIAAYSGAIWLNRRSPAGANLGTCEALAALVAAAHGFGVPVFLALNAPSYNDRQVAAVAALARRAVGEAGVDALIVSDIGLLLTLADLGLRAKIHVSSIASTLNAQAIDFYRELGVSRVILPRALRLGEIRELAGAAADRIELEVFVLNDGCAFEEGLCHTLHHHRVGAFCSNIPGWSCEAVSDRGEALGEEARHAVAAQLQRYREWIWYLNGCGGLLSPRGLPCGPCGLCAIPELAAMRITSVKIAGREASPFRKLASVRLVKVIADMVRSGAPAADVLHRAREIRATPGMCDSRFMCYYRDFRSGEAPVPGTHPPGVPRDDSRRPPASRAGTRQSRRRRASRARRG